MDKKCLDQEQNLHQYKLLIFCMKIKFWNICNILNIIDSDFCRILTMVC